MKLALSRRAAADIRAIADYTIAQWGIDQAEQYIAGLRNFLEALATRNDPGIVSPHLPGPVRRAKYRAYFVFFEVAGDQFRVVRILHEQMDHVRHLTSG